MKMRRYCKDRTCGDEDCSTCYPMRSDTPECPKCGGDLDKRHHDGSFLVPECDWLQCNDCDYRTEPQ